MSWSPFHFFDASCILHQDTADYAWKKSYCEEHDLCLWPCPLTFNYELQMFHGATLTALILLIYFVALKENRWGFSLWKTWRSTVWFVHHEFSSEECLSPKPGFQDGSGAWHIHAATIRNGEAWNSYLEQLPKSQSNLVYLSLSFTSPPSSVAVPTCLLRQHRKGTPPCRILEERSLIYKKKNRLLGWRK